MNIWLKELSMSDDKVYCDLLIELAKYEDVYARPVPKDFLYSEFEDFKKNRIRMRENDNLPSYVIPTSTFWVMDGDNPLGYETLKHRIDMDKPGGHFGLCLKKEYQNKGIGSIVSELLSKIAYYKLGIDEVIYTSKDENIQSQKSVEKIGGNLVKIEDGYHFYTISLKEKFEKERKTL